VTRVREVVQAAFAHRRKTVANSLELSGIATRSEAVAALAELGRAPDVRPQALGPTELLHLSELLS
jgi:16S rRNA A1518/A1519 N6-dimethyltransferase RsmA/KsgA/DIM1 with predicted DNA glycosylase/AP lyase activity